MVPAKTNTTVHSTRFIRLLTLIVLAVTIFTATATLARSSAATTDYQAPTVATTPLNDAKYSVKVTWTPGAKNKGVTNTATQWRIKWLKGSTQAGNVFITNYSTHTYTATGLTCGASYTFYVRAVRIGVKGEDVAESDYGTHAATAPCPSVNFTSFIANGTTSLSLTWAPSAFTTSSTVHLKTGAGSFATINVGNVHSYGTSASCGNTYSAFITASAGGQTGAASGTRTIPTPACPVSPKPPVKAPAPPGHTTSGGSTGSSAKTSGTVSKTTVSAPQLPAAPTAFTAIIQSSKVVNLTWDPSTASAGIKQYNLERSTDNTNWSPLTTTTTTSYEDDGTSFSTTYYYRVQAVDNSGNVSDFASTQVNTGSFSSTSNKVVSDDKLVTVEVPGDAFSEAADCSVSSADDDSVSSVPAGQTLLAGPYDLLCVGQDGAVLDSFAKPLKISVNISQLSSGFKDFSVRTIDGSNSSSAKSNYDPKTHTINFELTSNKSFGAYGVRHKSPVGVIFGVFLGLLVIGGLVVGVLFLKRRQAVIDTSPTSPAAASEFETAVAKPNCTHLNMALQVQPQSNDCQECVAAGRQWKGLRICLTCGHVGCSDDSEGQDARKHFEATGHPLIMSYGDPAVGNIGWCYIDQTYI